jgi:proteasome accessory factor B
MNERKKKLKPARRTLKREVSAAEADPRGTLRMLESIFKIHWLLRKGGVASRRRLEEELETSSRTVQRYLEFMRTRLHADIIYDSANQGYKYEGEPAEISTAMLDEVDFDTMAQALPLLSQYRGAPFGKRFEKTLKKMTAKIPARLRERSEQSPLFLHAKSRAPLRDHEEYFQLLLDAANKRLQLDLTYYSASSGVTGTRIVEPYALCVVNARWYLLAYDLRRKRVLKFAVERIWSAGKTGKRFERSSQFSPAQHLQDAFGIYQSPDDEKRDAELIRVRFDALAARYVKDTQWHPSQTMLRREDGSVELTFSLRGTIEVEAFILSWGEHAEILEPLPLRALVRNRLERALAKYA